MTEHDDVHLDEQEAAQDGPADLPKAPYPKVQAAGFGGAVVTVLMFLAPLVNVEVPAEVAAALATVLAYAAAYVRTE